MEEATLGDTTGLPVVTRIHTGGAGESRVNGATFDEVLYADDTIVVTQDEDLMDEMLRGIEVEGARMGMVLNVGKTEALVFGPVGELVTAEGRQIKRVAVARGWDEGVGGQDCGVHGHVQNAVIRSKLVYGLESMQLNDTALKKMDVFQLKGLRKVLGMKTTFVNRANSNREVFRRAEAELNRGRPEGAKWKRIMKLSDYYEYLKLYRYARLVAAPEGDPSAAATFDRETLGKHQHGKRRVGRPRLNWVEVTQKQFWNRMVLPYIPLDERVPLDLGIQAHVDM
eukprot:857513-Alexandrium_andersonii.AAC.1